jgi:hypothetical protein
MPTLVIIDSAHLEKLTKDLVERKGYQKFVSGYYPREGVRGDTHWPTKNILPLNTLYHPTQAAEECSREIFNWAEFQGMPADKVLAFETPHWYANVRETSFDHDKPGIKWEDFPGRAPRPEEDSNLAY